MLVKTSGLVLLLLIMLNHAVMACDALVMHMPDHDHVYTNLIDSHPASSSTNHLIEQQNEQSAEHNTAHNSEQHSEHAHVSCHIAFFHGLELLNISDGAIVSAKANINLISYRPPVPPPNA